MTDKERQNAKWRRKAIRKDVSSWGWALLIHYIILTLCVTGGMMLQLVLERMGPSLEGKGGSPASNGWGYLVGCALGVLLIRLWKGRVFFGEMWQNNRNMTTADFVQLLCVFISGQLLFSICATFQETVLNMVGLSALEALEQATGGVNSISMFLYLALGAPIVEEIIFRGAILRGLERYGKRFAIVISALLFGVFHGNIVQSPYAFIVGLVLGYVAMEYNILWAMLLHMINNLILGDTIPRLTQGLGEEASAAVLSGVILVCSSIGVFTLIRKNSQVAEYQRKYPLDWSCMGPFATAPGVVVLIIVMEISAISMLFL